LAAPAKARLNRTMLLFVIGHDGADGIIELDRRPTVRAPGRAARAPAVHLDHEQIKAIATQLGGMFVSDPLDTRLLLNNLITVHPLGGCPMGDDPRNAVVDDSGASTTRAARAAAERPLRRRRIGDPDIARREPAASRSRRSPKGSQRPSPTTSAGAPRASLTLKGNRAP